MSCYLFATGKDCAHVSMDATPPTAQQPAAVPLMHLQDVCLQAYSHRSQQGKNFDHCVRGLTACIT